MFKACDKPVVSSTQYMASVYHKNTDLTFAWLAPSQVVLYQDKCLFYNFAMLAQLRRVVRKNKLFINSFF